MAKTFQLPGILGQDLALSVLQAAINQDRVTTAYCFAGPIGVGRSLTARWLAQVLLCEAFTHHDVPLPCQTCLNCRLVQQGTHPDLLWIEPTFYHQGKLLTVAEAEAAQVQKRSPPQIRLEQVHALVAFTARAPLRSHRSVVVMDGSETLAESAANALLKTLEDPGQATLILMTPNTATLLPTLVSRCQCIPFRRLSSEQLTEILRHQGYSTPSPLLLTLAQGSPGQAIQAIEQWQSIPPEIIDQLQSWPESVIQALTLARMVAKTLDIPTQLWLIEYLQYYFWHQQQTHRVKQLEHMRKQLLQFVQPQLVWEVNLSIGP